MNEKEKLTVESLARKLARMGGSDVFEPEEWRRLNRWSYDLYHGEALQLIDHFDLDRPVVSVEEIQRHLRNIDRLTHYENGAPLVEIWSEIQSRVGDIQKLIPQLPAPVQGGGGVITFEEWDLACNGDREETETTRRGWFNLARNGFPDRINKLEERK